MIALTGTYHNGTLHLDEEVRSTDPLKVIVTFLEVETKESLKEEGIKGLKNFSFSKTRVLLKDLKSSLSDEIIEERRN